MRLSRLAILCAIAVGAMPGTAAAAIVSGSSLSQPPNASVCAPGVMLVVANCTAAITGLPPANRAPGGALAGASGVITAWSIRTGATAVPITVRLRLIRNDTGVGTGPSEALPNAAGTYTFPARLPVVASDMIGVDTLNVPELMSVPILRNTAGATLDYWLDALADGETRGPMSDEAGPLELLVNARIEPDGDGDGWGDETQDKCVGSNGANEGCPPPGAGSGGGSVVTVLPAVPDTKILSGPKGTIGAKKATFRFSSTVAGSAFQCKLDKKPFRSCKSPKAYNGLAVGSHAFRVRAVGPTGRVDPSPAKRSFKVEL